MTGDLRQQPKRAGRITFPKLAVVAVIAGAALVSACSQPSDTQQTAQQQAADEQARKEADEKAWADAEKSGCARARQWLMLADYLGDPGEQHYAFCQTLSDHPTDQAAGLGVGEYLHRTV
jgi:hypothetical protein